MKKKKKANPAGRMQDHAPEKIHWKEATPEELLLLALALPH